MRAPIIASTSYTTREGTYTIEVGEVGGGEANEDLRLTQKPRVRASLRDGDLFGLVEHDIRLRVHDVGKTLSDKLRNGTDLRVHIDGPITFRGPVESQYDARRMLTDGPVIDLKVSDGYDRLKGVDLSLGTLPVAEAAYDLLAPLTELPLRTNFDWTHDGQDSNLHPSRAVRMPLADLRPATHLGALTTLVRQWNCQLYQKGSTWRLLHRLATGDVVEYDGSSYSSASMEGATVVSSSDVVQSVNGNQVPTCLPSLPALGEISSAREYPDHRTIQNGNFDEWTDGNPVDWTVDGSVTDEGSAARLDSTADTLSQRATLPLTFFLKKANDLRIKGKAKVYVPDDSTYTVRYAVVYLDGHPDRDPRYIDQSGNLQNALTYWQVSFSVPGGGTATFSFDEQVTPESPSRAMLPRVELSFSSPDGADVLWAEYEIARYDLSYEVEVVTQSSWLSNADGTTDSSFESAFGDWRRWSPLYGVVEYYTGSAWEATTGLWLQGGTRYDLHKARLRELLQQRQNRLPGVDFRFDRWTLLGSRPVEFDGTTYLPVKADVQLGAGSSRLVGYAQRDVSPQHEITMDKQRSSV